MSEQLNEEFDDDLSPEELFEQAIKTSDVEDANADLEAEASLEEAAYDHQPTDDDPEEYWKGFAESKGWKSDPATAKPGYFTDYRAFVNKHDTIQESKASKAEAANLERKIDQLAKSQMEVAQRITQQHEREIADLKSKLEAKRANARDEGDFDEYEKAGEQLKALETPAVKDEPPVPSEAQPILDFRAKHPEILATSDNFDPDLNDLLQIRLNNAISSGKVTTEEQWHELAETTLTNLKSQSVKYQAKPTPTPPNSASANGRRPTAKIDVSSLNEGERMYYNHFMESGMKEAAAEFLKNAIEGRS